MTATITTLTGCATTPVQPPKPEQQCKVLTQTSAMENSLFGLMYRFVEPEARETHKFESYEFHTKEELHASLEELAKGVAETPEQLQTLGLREQHAVQEQLGTNKTQPIVITGSLGLYTALTHPAMSEERRAGVLETILDGNNRGLYFNHNIYLTDRWGKKGPMEGGSPGEVLLHERGHEIMLGFEDKHGLGSDEERDYTIIREAAAQYLGVYMALLSNKELVTNTERNKVIKDHFGRMLLKDMPTALLEITRKDSDKSFHVINTYQLSPLYLAELVDRHDGKLIPALFELYNIDLCVHPIQ